MSSQSGKGKILEKVSRRDAAVYAISAWLCSSRAFVGFMWLIIRMSFIFVLRLLKILALMVSLFALLCFSVILILFGYKIPGLLESLESIESRKRRAKVAKARATD